MVNAKDNLIGTINTPPIMKAVCNLKIWRGQQSKRGDSTHTTTKFY